MNTQFRRKAMQKYPTEWARLMEELNDSECTLVGEYGKWQKKDCAIATCFHCDWPFWQLNWATPSGCRRCMRSFVD